MKIAYKEVEKCRICGGSELIEVLSLGVQMLTGVFPREKNKNAATSGPLTLVKCCGPSSCGLVQLKHSYDLSEMYGMNYGYRSGLNKSMVSHLTQKVNRALNMVQVKDGDLVIDIGSNDATILKAYTNENLVLVGIDPTGVKFRTYYPDHVRLLPDFFSADLVKKNFQGKKAKIVTSFSMFYDLESPIDFMRQIHEILDDEGIWIFEQSYMPSMLDTNSFDTVCHEHLEFYGLHQIQFMASRVGFHIVDIEFNDINGGSFSVTVRKKSIDDALTVSVQNALEHERHLGLDTLTPYNEFSDKVLESKKEFLNFIKAEKALGKSFSALGASTKGNVLLQYYGLTSNEIDYVGEVNIEKVGGYTPGSWIPIIHEDALLEMKPDYLIVLPWHFKEFFMSCEKFKSSILVFPLPNLTIVQNEV